MHIIGRLHVFVYTVFVLHKVYIYIYESIPETPAQKSRLLGQKFRKRPVVRGKGGRNKNHCFLTILSEICMLGSG